MQSGFFDDDTLYIPVQHKKNHSKFSCTKISQKNLATLSQ